MTEKHTTVSPLRPRMIDDIGNSDENPDFDYVAGSCGNASLMTLTKALGGRSLDHGVRVLAVNPGSSLKRTRCGVCHTFSPDSHL